MYSVLNGLCVLQLLQSSMLYSQRRQWMRFAGYQHHHQLSLRLTIRTLL